MAITKKKVLVADDEKPLSKALQLKLEREGFLVSVANDGSEAIGFLEKDSFDILLLDLMMPKVDGFAVLQFMKDKKIKSPVIVLTNLSQEVDAARAKELGAVGCFVKSDTPITDVISQVKKILKM